MFIIHYYSALLYYTINCMNETKNFPVLILEQKNIKTCTWLKSYTSKILYKNRIDKKKKNEEKRLPV